MAINTSGHRVSVIPHYTPVNPSLLALDPSRAMTGMGQTLGLASLLDQIQAQRAAQDEMAATRVNRVNAINMANQAKLAQLGAEMPLYDDRAGLEKLKIGEELKTVPQRGNVERLKLSQDEVITPFETNAKKAKLKFDEQYALTETGIIPDMAKAKKAEASARTEVAGQTAQNAAGKGELDRVQTQIATELAKTTGPLLNQSALMNATIALANIPEGEERRKAAAALDMALKQSQIQENQAQAAYLLGQGRQSGTQETPEQKLYRLEKSLETLAKLKVSDGKTFAAYLAETYNPDGTVNQPFFGQRKLDPQGEFYKERQQEIQNEMAGVSGNLGSRQPAKASPKPTMNKPSAQSAGPTSAKGANVVSTKAEYDALPSGTRFKGADGKEYVKP